MVRRQHFDNKLYYCEDKILHLLNDRLITLSDNKTDILKYLDEIKPNIVHFEEMPEFFIDDKIAEKIYNKNRNYLIFETSHDSSSDPSSKKFLPDKFLFCSDNQLIKFRSIDVPACVIEYPVDKKKFDLIFRYPTVEQTVYLGELDLDNDIFMYLYKNVER